MPKNACFCVYDCARKDIAKTDSKHTKSIKTSTRRKKSNKVRLGIQKSKLKFRKSTEALLLFKKVKISPWIIFMKLAEKALALSFPTLMVHVISLTPKSSPNPFYFNWSITFFNPKTKPKPNQPTTHFLPFIKTRNPYTCPIC